MDKLKQTGDTIVEVMICMAVIGFSLGSALGITGRSLTRIRTSQDRSESLKYAEEQIERLKQLAQTNPGGQISTATDAPRLGGVRYSFKDTSGNSADIGGGIYLFCITDTLQVQPMSQAQLSDMTDPTCKLDPRHMYKVGIYYDANNAANRNPTNDFYIIGAINSLQSEEIVNTKNFVVSTLTYRLD